MDAQNGYESDTENMLTIERVLYSNRLKDSEAFSLQLEEERSAHSAQLEDLYIKLKEQKTAYSARVKKLKEVRSKLLIYWIYNGSFKTFHCIQYTPPNMYLQGIRHAKKRIDALETELSLANNGSCVVVPDAKKSGPSRG